MNHKKTEKAEGEVNQFVSVVPTGASVRKIQQPLCMIRTGAVFISRQRGYYCLHHAAHAAHAAHATHAAAHAAAGGFVFRLLDDHGLGGDQQG